MIITVIIFNFDPQPNYINTSLQKRCYYSDSIHEKRKVLHSFLLNLRNCYQSSAIHNRSHSRNFKLKEISYKESGAHVIVRRPNEAGSRLSHQKSKTKLAKPGESALP